MDTVDLLEKIKRVEDLANASKLKRMLKQPFNYISVILFRELIYKRKKVSKTATAKTFFDVDMHLLLPASTDIYLTGGKSHHSEIRLAKFFIKNLKPNHTFIDVGAHYGYFTLLASKIMGKTGKIFSFEASTTSYNILKKNAKNISNVTIINKAVSDTAGNIEFYEFPNLYAEYNSIDATQFKTEEWFTKFSPKKVIVESLSLSTFFQEKSIKPNIIKIDVEGAELKVIKGLTTFIKVAAPIIIIEYLSKERGNDAHQQAAALLNSFGFKSHSISQDGTLKFCSDIDHFLNQNDLDSDNIAFVKS